ncbi:PAS domain-containing sensor histidine kinase [Ramlibacter terrae]|uniref:histidine kinase n=1 Tax=Ramlibacter terrae TaxID=2732511 RepID=A0ABX6P7Q3_9BURK|nr:PAS domain-containing sensor histidine kinase [Ramlibacter terrae]
MGHAREPEPAFELVHRWLEHSSDHALVVLDPAGLVVGWLAGSEDILGFTADEALGRHIAFIFTDDDKAKGYPDYELKVAARDSHSEDSRWHARRDGTRIWVSGTVSAVKEPGGELLGFVKLMRDHTDLRTQLERFENQVDQLAEAREKTHLFLKTLGHELRNPLGVLSNTQQILGRLVSEERTRKAVEQFGAQVAVLRRLADDLMDVSRLELGKLELARERADLREILQVAAASFEEAARRKSITLETLLPPTPLWVDVDRARIQQVVLNLLGNAIKYTHVGGSVWIKATQEADEIVAWVQDTGIGIFPPLLPRIFDLFSQAPEGHGMSEGGIGVGLALVRQLVELHGGSVQAKSSGLGKGSEFSFRLPAVPDLA